MVQLQIHYYRFFISLFEAMQGEIAKLCPGRGNYQELAQAWRQHLASKAEGSISTREKFYNVVLENARDAQVWDNRLEASPILMSILC